MKRKIKYIYKNKGGRGSENKGGKKKKRQLTNSRSLLRPTLTRIGLLGNSTNKKLTLLPAALSAAR